MMFRVSPAQVSLYAYSPKSMVQRVSASLSGVQPVSWDWRNSLTLEGFKMFMKQQVGLVAVAIASMAISGVAAAAAADSTMTVSATLTSGCIVSSASAIGFGSFTALAVTGDKTADSGSTFQVACSNSATPTISSATTRQMANGSNVLPFSLSVVSAGGTDLSAVSTAGSSLPGTYVQDGDLHDVVIYAKTLASNFKSLPSGAYTADMTVSVTY